MYATCISAQKKNKQLGLRPRTTEKKKQQLN
jgi:hypothetical protein